MLSRGLEAARLKVDIGAISHYLMHSTVLLMTVGT